MTLPVSRKSELIRKVSSEGVGYSVVELNDVRHVFAAAVPRCGDTFDEQAYDALKTIEAVNQEEGTRGAIVKQAIFLPDERYLGECKKLIKDFYGPEMPATTYILQPPCSGKLISIEALGVGRAMEGVAIRRINDQVVVAEHSKVVWTHCGNVVPGTDSPRVYDRALDAFRRMEQILRSVGARFEQVIRTWLYLGDIVGMEGDRQRYMELNRARADFYQNIRFQPGKSPPGTNPVFYPASTGIGAQGKDIVMSCIAFSAKRDDIVVTPLENPLQTSAYNYDCRFGPKSPKFSRAMALSCGAFATIFVSGTASITNSETRHVGDPIKQTEQTLDNIEALISHDNLARHGMPGHGATMHDLALVRVYVKRREDFEVVHQVCERRLGEVPTVYAIADVCRPELLVEIEGIAFSRHKDIS